MNYNQFIEENGCQTEFKKVENKTFEICIDTGSTETRGVMFNAEELLSSEDMDNNSTLSIDTSTIRLKEDIVARTGSTIANNLEVVVNSPTGDSWHFAKGNIRKYLSKKAMGMSATTSKVDQKLTRQSILFHCALMCLCNANETGELADVYNINLTMSLPPEDTEKNRIELMKKNLLGEAVIDFVRLGVSIKLNINMVEIYGEPVAIAHYYCINNYDAVNGKNIVFIDCGGRSKGAVLVSDGTQVLNGTVTDIGGGEKYLVEVAKNIVATYSTSLPDIERVREGITCGYIENGSDILDITMDMEKAKQELAEACYFTINRLLDITTTQVESVNKIVCTGRTFLPTVKDGKVVSKSLVEYLEDEMEDLELPIIFERYPDDNPVVKGLFYYAVNRLMSEV